jgi:uncharacterized protein (UPF0212 family)
MVSLCPPEEWQKDTTVSNCPKCGDDFSVVFTRRHHCRLCGLCFCDE